VTLYEDASKVTSDDVVARIEKAIRPETRVLGMTWVHSSTGVRLPILQRMMGHADDTTTLRYIQLSMADIADEYQRAVEQIQHRYRDRE